EGGLLRAVPLFALWGKGPNFSNSTSPVSVSQVSRHEAAGVRRSSSAAAIVASGEMLPGPSRADVVNGLRADPKLFGYCAVRFVRISDHANLSVHQLVASMTLPEGPLDGR